ncbi:flavodoxin family protein [Ruminococcus callidus]|uniref:flavodoxin family protein n=2 Tax=Ruminococcus callidus TaxID=40519 RepID=UPI003521E5DE
MKIPVCKRGEPMKRILVILGGGRPKGNTRQLAGTFIQGAVDAGHEVELVSLSQVEVKSCIGCNTCRYGKPCVQKDGFSELVLKIKAADLLVFASPLLFWTISAKLKAFLLPRRGRHESAIRTV